MMNTKMMNTLTKEQQNIINAIDAYNNIKIFAFAGTGKTTTLQAIAYKHKNKKILYLAFNKSVEKEAKKKFGPNVEVKTTHALAYKFMCKLYNVKELRMQDVVDIFKVDYNTAYNILNTFEAFCNSHYIKFDDFFKTYKIVKEIREKVKELYKKMRKKQIQANHSFYLKEFHLKLVKGEIKLEYDIVLLDEAQDTNPVTFEIFKLIKANKKIMVGDKHQQIYAFRGAINVFNKFNAKQFYLTNSFRFNENIAREATEFLKLFKNERNTIKGLGNKKDIKTKAIISRTNSKLVEQVSSLIKNNEKFKFVRNPEEIFKLSLNVLKFKNNEKLDKEFNYLKKFNDFEDLLETTKKESFFDIELKTATKIVNKFGDDLVDYYEKAVEYFNDENLETDYYLTTAHTAKGLEWDEIKLLDDFNFLYYKIAEEMKKNNGMNFTPIEFLKKLSNKNFAGYENLENEINLFYVAYTRAKVKVINNSCVEADENVINTFTEDYLSFN